MQVYAELGLYVPEIGLYKLKVGYYENNLYRPVSVHLGSLYHNAKPQCIQGVKATKQIMKECT